MKKVCAFTYFGRPLRGCSIFFAGEQPGRKEGQASQKRQ